MKAFELFHDPPVGFDHPAFELERREAACPAVEQLHRLYPCLDLAGEIGDGRFNDRVDDRTEAFRVLIGEASSRALILTALPGDHIGRDGPGAARKAEESDRRVQRRLYLPDGLIDGLVAVQSRFE